jgi:hypothetical protein
MLLSIARQQCQKTPYNAGRVGVAFFGTEPLGDTDTMLLEQPVAFMVVRCAGMEGAIHFQDTPLPLVANQEVGFPIQAMLLTAEASQAVGQKQDSSGIQGHRYADLAPRAKAEVSPNHNLALGDVYRLVVNPSACGNFQQLCSPVWV